MRFLLVICAITAAASAQQAPISGNGIRNALFEAKEIVAAEYALLLDDTPGVSGTVTLSLTVDPGGALSDIEVTCDDGLQQVADALEEAVADMDFGPGLVSEPIRVSVPFGCIPPGDQTN